MVLKFVGHKQARGTSANNDNIYMSLGVNWSIQPPSAVKLWGHVGGKNEVCHFG